MFKISVVLEYFVDVLELTLVKISIVRVEISQLTFDIIYLAVAEAI